MESRKVFLRAALSLRVNKARVVDLAYPHSGLTQVLYADIIESQILLDTQLGYMQTIGALHAHSNADIEKAGPKINKMYINALGTIPYLTGGQSADEVISADRQKFIDEYQEFVKAMQPKPKTES